ncbi:MAG: hypothetical protein WAN11_12690 [Syntrophobacteraceae bacterium]
MRKFLIGGAIVFLTIFTAGLATATSPTLPCTSTTPCTGTLWFADNTGAITTGPPPTGVWTVTDTTTGTPVTVTFFVTQYGTIAGEPNCVANDLFFGELVYTDLTNGSTTTTVKFSAIRGDDGGFTFNGASSNGSADVRGTFAFKYGERFGKEPSTVHGLHHSQPQPSLVIRGAILDTSTVSNAVSFEGVFTPPAE